MTRVLVTGASGFIGRQVVPLLAQRGYEVHAVSRREPAPEPAQGRVFRHACNLLSEAAAAALMREVAPTHLMHFAWYVEPGRFWSAMENLDWVAASLRLFRRFAECGGRRAVLAGTCAEYDWSHETLSEAGTPVAPRTLYGAAKDGLRRIIESAARQSGAGAAWGRIFFLYGPHEPAGRLVPSIISGLLAGQPVACTHGRQLRDFMHVADAAEGFVKVMESAWEGPVNIASGETVPVAEVARTLGRLMGRPELVQLGARPSDPGEPDRLAADVTILREKIGFLPRYDLEGGLRQTIEWWKQRSLSGCS